MIRRSAQKRPISNTNEGTANEFHVELTRKGALTTDTHSFYLEIPSTDGPPIGERIEWRHSGTPEVKALATDNVDKENDCQTDRGLKLVNVRTGHLIAVFAGGNHSKAYNPRKIAGKRRFIGAGQWSEEFRVVVVMSMLSIMERA
jgi:hypothetical protein